jgi:beta-ribofuranosylaminobenzene 5'-phosphate synthase
MLEMPAAIVDVGPSESLRLSGKSHLRARAAVQRWCETTRQTLDQTQIHVDHLIDQHVGLGSGTQLALAIASALFQLHGETNVSIQHLAECAGRGGRSSVGCLGFGKGGFIFERGRDNRDRPPDVATSYWQASIPSAWRLVICRPQHTVRGFSGAAEQAAFDQLPAVPEAITHRLVANVEGEMIPALEKKDVMTFGEAVYKYGRLAGECFSAVQGGPFASSQVSDMIAAIRDFGVPGVGQSSWGPSVFAITADDAAAAELTGWLNHKFQMGLHIAVTAASAHGAQSSKIHDFDTNAL